MILMLAMKHTWKKEKVKGKKRRNTFFRKKEEKKNERMKKEEKKRKEASKEVPPETAQKKQKKISIKKIVRNRKAIEAKTKILSTREEKKKKTK